MSKRKQKPSELTVLPDRRGRMNADQSITPALESSDLANFKRLMGVCMYDDCNKIAGHPGDHS